MALLTGKSAALLSYDQVREKLKARTGQTVGLKDIPLDAIVGSVGRYADFTRSFLPRQDSDEQRWARVRLAVTDLEGVPPIDVYQIGDVYFVRDGNHRVSVARQFGATHIQAYVTEIQTRVPLTPDIQPDELILKAEYAAFLEQTGLDQVRPQANLSLTVPGQYGRLVEHIEVHRYFMGLDEKREVPYAEAVGHWYNEVYLPVAEVIRNQGLLRDFPGRTETDLYLWLAEHRAELQDSLGWSIEPVAAAADLASRFSPRPQRVVARVGGRVLDAVTPEELEAGPSPGRWREERVLPRREDRLFVEILVPIGHEPGTWYALDQALGIAQREGARLRGLHVVHSTEEAQSEEALAIQAEFDRRCEGAGIPGKLAIQEGKVARTTCRRARWTDLVVVRLAHPPAPQVLTRLSSGFRTLVRRCARPVLAVPGPPSPLTRALLAYDGSPKAKEALFVAAYVASQWQLSLVVTCVLEGTASFPPGLAQTQAYLEARGVQAAYVQRKGPVADTILRIAQEHNCDLLLMGGYGHTPVVEIVLGSSVDQVLRESRQPVLICR
jgi:nucleotide-binding universal stress UspA family protein